MRNKVYISGKMSSLSEESIQRLFGKAEKEIRKKGYKVCNPARWRWFLKYLPYRFALVFDLLMMCRCDTIYMLEGWTESSGATLEHRFACVTGMIITFER